MHRREVRPAIPPSRTGTPIGRERRPPAFLPLLAAVLLLLFSGCGNENDETVTVSLRTDAPCYGVEIDIEPSVLSQITCLEDSELVSEDCEYAYQNPRTGLSVGGCWVKDDTRLFVCSGPHVGISRLQVAEVRCGCGCNDSCPTDPELVVCDVADWSCAEDFSRSASNRDGESSSPSGHPSTSRSHVPRDSELDLCLECCAEYGRTHLRSRSSSGSFGEEVRELEFDILLPEGDELLCPSIDCSASLFFRGPARTVRLAQNRLRVCVSSAQPRSLNRRLVANCSVARRPGDRVTFAEVRSLDDRLRPNGSAVELFEEAVP